jgi:ATP/maltotriose-dependent transcriptional regulator MalT
VLASGLTRAIAATLKLDLEAVLRRIQASSGLAREADDLAVVLAEHIPTWPTDCWLVIDGYESLTRNSACEEFIEALLSHDTLNAIVATRVVPRWASARRVIYGEILELRATDLAFVDAEARAVFDAFRSSHDRSLLRLANGWPAVVNLVARGTAIHIRQGAGLRHFVAEEVCCGLDSDVIEYLSVLAVLAPQSRRRLIEMAGQDLTRRTIADALHAGALVELPDGSLEVHTVLRRFFDDQSDLAGFAASESEVALRVGQVLIDDGEYDEAFSLVERFQDEALFTRLVAAGLSANLDDGHVESVAAWIEFGRSHGACLSELTSAEAELALRSGRYIRAEALSRIALGETGLPSVLKARARMTAGRASHLAGRESEALEYYRDAQMEAPDSDTKRMAQWAVLAVASDLEMRDAWSMLGELERSAPNSPAEQVRLAYSALLLATRSGTFGSLADARASLELVERVHDPYLTTAFRNVYSYVSAVVGDYERALEEVEKLEQDARRLRLDFVRPYALLARAIVALGLREFEAAFEHLDDACDHARGHDGFAIASAAAIRARGLLALSHFEDAVRFTTLDIYPLARSMRGEVIATRSLALACAGEHQLALMLAEQATALSRATEVPFLSDAARAVVNLHRDIEECHHQSRRLVARARELSYIDGLLTVVRACPELGRLMAASSDHREWLRDVLSRSNDHDLVATLGFGIRRGSVDNVLSPREAEVLSLLRQGMTNRQIAEALHIAEGTVKVHVHRTYEKLGVKNRTEAALLLIRD